MATQLDKLIQNAVAKALAAALPAAVESLARSQATAVATPKPSAVAKPKRRMISTRKAPAAVAKPAAVYTNTAVAELPPLPVRGKTTSKPKASKPGRTDAERAAHDQNESLSMVQVQHALHKADPATYACCYIVGRWLWCELPSKPSDDVCKLLYTLGFHWSAARKAWQHPCGTGYHARNRKGDPRQSYGVQAVA